MDEPTYFNPAYPPANLKLERAIGKFIIAWAILEESLDGSIAAILMIDATLSLCITANLGTKGKIDLLRSAVSMSHEMLDDELVKDAHSALAEISTLSGEFRNSLIHGAPFCLASDKEGHEWRWGRTSARTFMDFRSAPYTAERWQEATAKVKTTTKKWCRIWQIIWHEIAAIPRDKRDWHYAYGMKPL